jgi:putative oxidoreductase
MSCSKAAGRIPESLIFHHNFADQIQAAMFPKNVSIAGAFLLLVAYGAGPLSIDRRLAN